jgi:hypothetical protein
LQKCKKLPSRFEMADAFGSFSKKEHTTLVVTSLCIVTKFVHQDQPVIVVTIPWVPVGWQAHPTRYIRGIFYFSTFTMNGAVLVEKAEEP